MLGTLEGRSGVESRRRQIVAIVLVLFLIITTMPIAGTQSNVTSSSSSGASLTGVIHDDQGVDSDGNGLFDYLKVGVQVNVNESGIYRVSISGLLTSNGSYINIYKDKSMYLDTGLQVINIPLHGPTIYLSRLNPANVSQISLYDETGWLPISTVTNVPLSHEYSYEEFDTPGANLTGVIFDKGVDTDSDTLFDYLEVAVQVNVT